MRGGRATGAGDGRQAEAAGALAAGVEGVLLGAGLLAEPFEGEPFEDEPFEGDDAGMDAVLPEDRESVR